MELEESTFLTSDYTTKLQSSHSMVLAQKQKYISMEKDRKPFLTKKARIYNGAKTASLISGTGKSGQLHAKE